MADMYNRYFIYSAEQKKEKQDIAKKTGGTYIPGTVIVNGRPKPYTDIVRDSSKFRYGDTSLVA